MGYREVLFQTCSESLSAKIPSVVRRLLIGLDEPNQFNMMVRQDVAFLYSETRAFCYKSPRRRHKGETFWE